MVNGYRYALEDLAEFLQEWGVMDILLPFLLIFTIIFAVLQKTRILGEGKKQFNVVIALVVALSVVIPHVTDSYPTGFDVVEIINMMLPQIALIAVVLIMILILVGVFAPGYATWIAVVGAIVVILLFIGTTEYIYGLDWLYDFLGEEIISLALILLVFGLIIWFVTTETTGEKIVSTGESVLKRIFGGG